MKKLFLHNPGMIILSITLFLLTESSWLIYWFRIEEKNFRNDINQAIHAAIQEEAYRINEEDDSFVDFRIENARWRRSVRNKYRKTCKGHQPWLRQLYPYQAQSDRLSFRNT